MDARDFESRANAPIPPASIRLAVSGSPLDGETKVQAAEALSRFAEAAFSEIAVRLPSGSLLPASDAFETRTLYGESHVELSVSPRLPRFLEAVGPMRSLSDVNRALGQRPRHFPSLALRAVGAIFPSLLEETLETSRRAVAREIASDALSGAMAALGERLKTHVAPLAEAISPPERRSPKP